jgi:hypothetical protein
MEQLIYIDFSHILTIINRMEKVQRKITYRMYPNATQDVALKETLALHCRVYNTLLEEHRRRHKAGEPFYSYKLMCRDLTTWRSYSSLRGLNAQGLQVTAKRVALAFSAFFRRLAAGDKPGYPRFKTVRRFNGWGCKTHGDGWRLMPGENGHGTRCACRESASLNCAARAASPERRRLPRFCGPTENGISPPPSMWSLRLLPEPQVPERQLLIGGCPPC